MRRPDVPSTSEGGRKVWRRGTHYCPVPRKKARVERARQVLVLVREEELIQRSERRSQPAVEEFQAALDTLNTR